MTSKESAARYVVEFELNPTPLQRSIMDQRFRVTCQMYNALISAYQKKYNKLQNSPLMKEYRNTKDNKQKKELQKQFFKEFGSEYDSYKIMSEMRNSSSKTKGDNVFKQHMAAVTGQAIAFRAYRVWEAYAWAQFLYPHKGTGYKRPKYKSFRRYESVPSNNETSIAVKAKGPKSGVMLHWSTDGGTLSVPIMYNHKDPFHRFVFNEENGLLSFRDPEGPCVNKVLRRTIRGKKRYFLQMTMKGITPIIYKNQYANEGSIGLDMGPSTIGIVGKDFSKLLTFCSELDLSEEKLSKLQQKSDRQRRANNPHNYNPNGTCKHISVIGKEAKRDGRKRLWVVSKAEQKTKNDYKDLKRKQADYRKSLHGKLVNEICKHGVTVFTEKVYVQAWQSVFGKSIGNRAPGMFQSLLKNRINTLGGSFNEIKTQTTALSQHCVCGNKKKKELSERVHKCDVCGLEMQRDLMSAYLALHVEPSHTNKKEPVYDTLNIPKAKESLPQYKEVMDKAWVDTKVSNAKRRIVISN